MKLLKNIDESGCLFIANDNLSDSTPITSYSQYVEVTGALKKFRSPLKETLTENLAVDLADIDCNEAGGLILGFDIAYNVSLLNELENQPIEYMVYLLVNNKIVSEDYKLLITHLGCQLTFGSNEMDYNKIIQEVAYVIEDIYNKDLKEAKKLLNLNDRES